MLLNLLDKETIVIYIYNEVSMTYLKRNKYTKTPIEHG